MNFFLLILAYFNIANSQSIHLYNVDASDYPIIKGDVIVLSQEGNKIYDPNKANFTISEFGIDLPILTLECPEFETPKPVSTILSIDLSQSMKGLPIRLASEGAKSLIEIMDDSSEVAISGFSDIAILVNDFSNDRILLSQSIDNMQLIGGTNFDEAFLNENFGALKIAENSKHKPVIIILTDGEAQGNHAEVIRIANELGAVVHSLVLFNQAPEFLSKVSKETGGLIFENLKDEPEIRAAYQTIYRLSENSEPCKITWESQSCNLKREITYAYLDNQNTTSYEIDNVKLSRFDFPDDKYYSFKTTEFGNVGRRVVRVKATADTIIINDLTSSNSKFTHSLDASDFPIVIPRDSLFSFFIDFNFNVQGFQFSKFEFDSDVCQNFDFYASGGVPFGANADYIDIIEPNGGEVYFRGADTTIRWQANDPNDNLLIEFSSNNGNSWQEIQREYKGYETQFRYPLVTSDDCLVRVTKFSDSSGYEYTTTNTDSINNDAISWQGNGNNIIVGGTDGNIRFIDAFTHTQYKKLSAHQIVNDVEWAPDAFRFASAGSEGKIKMWVEFEDEPTDSVVAYEGGEVTCIEWNSDGTRLISGDNFGNLKVWNPANFELIKEIKISQRRINDIRFSPDERKIAVALSDTSIAIVFSSNLTVLNKYPVHRGAITSLDWLDNDRIVSVSSQAFNNDVILSSSNLSAPINSFRVNETLDKVRVNHEDQLFTFTGNKGKTYIYGFDFTEKFNIEQLSSWRNKDLAWSPDFTRIAVSSYGKNSGQTVKFISINQYPEYRTTSDSTFSLINAIVDRENIDFGEVLIKRTKDSTFSDILTISSKIPLEIDSIRLVNDNENVFQLFNYYEEIQNETQIYDINLTFSPKAVKTYSARLEIFTKLNKYITSVFGTGYSNGIKDYTLDFGVLSNTSPPIRKSIDISNSSIDDVLIDSIVIVGPDLTSFELISGNSPTLLKAKEENSKQLIFEFDPSNITLTNSIANIYFSDDYAPARIYLIGASKKPILKYTLSDTVSFTCVNKKEFEIKFENIGLDTLIVSDIGSANINFEKQNLKIAPHKEETISAQITLPYQGTTDLNFEFFTNDSDFPQINHSFVFKNENSELDIAENNILFEVSQSTPTEKNYFEVINRGNLVLNFDYNLPFKINNSDFQIINITPTSISNNETATFTIEYTNSTNQDENETLIIEDVCSNSYTISLEALYSIGLEELSYDKNININAECLDSVSIPVKFQNSGNSSLMLTNVKSDLEIISDFTFPIEILAIDEFILDVKVKLDEYGELNKEIIFEIQGVEVIINVKIERPLIEFDIVENTKDIEIKSGVQTSSYFIVENKGDVELDWSNYLNQLFNGVEITDIQPVSTPLNSSSTFYFEYNELNENNILIELEDKCENNDEILLNFELGDIPQFDISISDIDANVGELIDLEINFNNYQEFDFADKKGVNFDLIYNGTLLKKLNNENHQALMSENISLLFNDLTQDNWHLNNYQVLWGNDSISALEINNIKFIDNDEEKVLEINNGLLRVLDLCQVGGTRLYKSNNYPFIESISPNPIDNSTSLNIFLTENSNIELRLIDLLGNEINYENYNLSKGNQSIPLKYYINSGIYFLKIQIQSDKHNLIFTEKINIIE